MPPLQRGPGKKKADSIKRKGHAPGVFGQTRRAWTKVFTTQAVMKLFPEPGGVEPGPDVKIEVGNQFGKTTLELTGLRVDELTALKGVFDLAFAHAYRTCTIRDQHAMQALESGEADYSRSFRDPAVLWKREGERWSAEYAYLDERWEGPHPEVVSKSHAPVVYQTTVSQDLDEDTGFADSPEDDD
ncbi:hypothetical protein SEA_BUTTERBALL_71 [Gordonia phage Butterball]|uniref:Uncharacterized protein n=3 Tax=Montyvirus TaxID=2733196 RepID=A0A2L1IWL1_9CAUD|nr:hypothetical protein HWC02_gp063 [Gordonia phage Sombrero]AVD99577.1 hypothetical protein SEA_BONEHAM_72 [Gordonia phage Boneham]QAY04030.1 hypothetical protein SEA_SOMBRERO_70 [Gordonia phage Sombrero]QAY16996.1 hypothetical protein SEA_BUTTERBALL_71 [Gordonia phage Butterball]